MFILDSQYIFSFVEAKTVDHRSRIVLSREVGRGWLVRIGHSGGVIPMLYRPTD
jgi:hypothetical protein